ncbi:MAG: restriction endonuclease subunit S [Candidatus Azambacteria bacterium]|nr:restriction endonuclease subunit S [Candidatus Azambacteria bacterium]
MITYSIIQKLQLEGARRLDAEYYQPEYLDLDLKLKNRNYKNLSDITKKIICGPFGSAILNEDYKESGVPLIRVADLNDWFIRDNNLIFIDDSLSESLKKYQVVDGDIVVSQRGTIAMFSRVTDKFPKWNISANLISIKKSENLNLNFDYLLAFLNSNYGINQLYRRLSGQVQPKITTDDIKQLLIFLPNDKDQEYIGQFAQQSRKELENSKNSYSQAENLLLEELGLKDFEFENELLWSVVNFSEVKKVNRIDAEYFQPKYENLESKIKKYTHKLLEMCIENVSAKFNPAKQPNKPFKYVELSNINASIGIIDGFSEMFGKEAPNRAKRVLKAGDVIVSSVEGSLEKVALVHEDQKDFLASTGFFQFRSKEILPEVLLILAKSVVFQWQLEKRCAGTILTAVSKESIKDVLVPILPKSTQQKIAELVRQSHEARKKAKQLLEEAKRKVEELIEKGSAN